MGFLKKIIFFLLFVILLACVISLFLPREMAVSKTAVINAPASQVFAQVNEFRNWEKWSPWKKMDPEMKITYGAKTSGVNGRYDWDGEKSGKGYMIIKESNPNSSLKTYLNFGGQGEGNGAWKFEEKDGKTEVTWSFNSDMGMNPIGKIMGVVMKGSLAQNLEDGLSGIAAQVEK